MSAKEHEKYHDDAVTIDDANVKRAAEKCCSFRWSFPEDAPFRRELIDIAEQEAMTRKATVPLNEHGHTPEMEGLIFSRLLPQVNEWKEVKAGFTRMLSPHSELLEQTTELKNQKAKLEQEREALTNTLAREWSETKDKFRADREEAADAEKKYKALYEQYDGRHAKIVNYWLYIPLLALIGLVEWLINWEAANALFAQPYLAAGIVMVIALAVAAASHEHGTLVKQWSHRCGFAADAATRRRNYTALAVTTLLFAAAMALVGYMRYKLAFEDLMGGTSFAGSNPFGARGTMGEVYTAVGMTLMGNFIVWLLGAMVAYWMHDSDPHFAEARVRHLKARARYTKWSQRLEKVRTERHQDHTMKINKIDSTLKSRNAQGKLLIDMADQVEEHERELLDRLKGAIDDLVRSYRRHLLAQVSAENSTLVFRLDSGSEITVNQYEALKVGFPIDTLEERMDIRPFVERRATKPRKEEEVAL